MIRRWMTLAAALAVAGAAAQTSPYAGEHARTIKSLSAQEVQDLLGGQGMGLAKAAELNGYPGPAHALEHAQALALSEEQRRSTEALMQAHKARARSLGAELVQAEQALDAAFAQRTVDAAALARLTAAVGAKQAQLREEHLRTHLDQTALLTAPQVRRYAEVRGYSAQAVPAPAPHHHPRNH